MITGVAVSRCSPPRWRRSPVRDYNGHYQSSAPAVAEELVFSASVHDLMAHDCENGDTVRYYDPAPMQPQGASPTVADGTVYAADHGDHDGPVTLAVTDAPTDDADG